METRKETPEAAGKAAHPKKIQAILDKPYTEWTGRDVGIVALYDTIEANLNKDYKRIFGNATDENQISIADVFIMLSQKERDLVIDYYDLFNWVVAADRVARAAETEREAYKNRLISNMELMSAAEQIIESYSGDVPEPVKEHYAHLLPEDIFSLKRYQTGAGETQQSRYIERIMIDKGVIFSDLACIVAYNKMLQLLCKKYGIPNLDKMRILFFENEENQNLVDGTFYKRSYDYLYNLIADKLNEKDMSFFQLLLKPEYVLSRPVLLDTWEKAVKQWIKDKKFKNPLDKSPITDMLDDSLNAAEDELYLPPEYQRLS